jgi:hypothetical protein
MPFDTIPVYKTQSLNKTEEGIQDVQPCFPEPQSIPSFPLNKKANFTFVKRIVFSNWLQYEKDAIGE